MNVHYVVKIESAENHMVTVKMQIENPNNQFEIFLPSWSPGSYLMREYSKNIRSVSVFGGKGEYVQFLKRAKGIWAIDLENKKTETLNIEYQIYCHELTVRTSHVDASHAFLHGPSYLMGVLDVEILNPTIEFQFPPLWSKVSTSLKDISDKRQKFIYQANNYDDLIDTPVEIGTQETDGFIVDGIPHHLAFYGQAYPHDQNLKQDIETIVKTVLKTTLDIPYETYLFLTHFKPKLYGGLEHKNSTALQYDGRKLANRKDYIFWLALVAHEYFHTWNVKRIRPVELGPFDYTQENYTSMHWLTEGLTSFMDEIFVVRSGLCSLEEYLELQTKNLKNYYSIPGKKFDSLESSSFDAWIKLYRPDENSKNNTISYYLKGGLVFSILNILLIRNGSSIDAFIQRLWQGYKKRPDIGYKTEEVLKIIEDLSSHEVKEEFHKMISTTEDIDFEKYYAEIGLELVWESSEGIELGITTNSEGDNIIVSTVQLDGAAHKAGLNAGDEIIAINNLRVKSDDISSWSKWLKENKSYLFTIARLGEIYNIDITPDKLTKTLTKININNLELAEKALL